MGLTSSFYKIPNSRYFQVLFRPKYFQRIPLADSLTFPSCLSLSDLIIFLKINDFPLPDGFCKDFLKNLQGDLEFFCWLLARFKTYHVLSTISIEPPSPHEKTFSWGGSTFFSKSIMCTKVALLFFYQTNLRYYLVQGKNRNWIWNIFLVHSIFVKLQKSQKFLDFWRNPIF